MVEHEAADAKGMVQHRKAEYSVADVAGVAVESQECDVVVARHELALRTDAVGRGGSGVVEFKSGINRGTDEVLLR